MATIVTQGDIPIPINGDLLVVEPYNGLSIPANRLPVGVYYVQDNEFKQANYQNLLKILGASISPNITPTVVGEILSVDIVNGTNTIPHDLNDVPDIVQFWQGNDLFVAGFVARVNSSEIIVYSTDDYSGIKISMLKF